MDGETPDVKPLTLTITVGGTKNKRSRARDDLALSPDQTKQGKRQRKVNSIFSGFALDKKTSHVLGQKEEEPEPEEEEEEVETKVETKSPSPAKRERERKKVTPKAEPVEQPPPQPSPEVVQQIAVKTELEVQVQSLSSKKAELENALLQLQQELKTMETAKAAAAATPPPPPPQQPVIVNISGLSNLQKARKNALPPKKKTVYDKFDSDEEEYEEEYDDEEPTPKKRGRRPGVPNSQPRGRKPGRAQRSTAGKKNRFYEDEDDEDPELAECFKVLQHLMKQQIAWAFLEPVDPVKLNIVDYFDVIKTPMDLGTVQRNFEAGEYTTPEEFASDVRLIWKNAMTYNPPDHNVHKWALTLSQMFEKKLARLQKKRSAPTPKPKPLPIPDNIPQVTPMAPPPPAQGVVNTQGDVDLVKNAMQTTITELRDSMKSVREEIAALRKEKVYQAPPPLPLVAPPPPVYKGPGRPPGSGKKNKAKKPAPIKETQREMTFEEKRQLSENINNLPQESLGKVVQIIHQRMPSLASNAPDEIEIDIDALDITTLWHLDRYVKNTLSKRKKVTPKDAKSVKERLRERSETTAKRGEENDDVVIDDDENKTYPSIVIEKDKGSSSSSSSSESESTSSTDSESSNDEKKKSKATPTEKAEPEPQQHQIQETTTPPGPSKAEEPKDRPLETSPKQEPAEEAPAIVQTGTQLKDVQLNNLDSWNMEWEGTAPGQSEQKKDETWYQMQKNAALNKQREKEREERERLEKEEKERERKKQEEQRLKELTEAEERKRKEEEEEKARAQRELLAKREAERKARQQVSAERTVMDQSLAMADFEQSFDGSSVAPLPLFKLKDEEPTEKKEDGEL